MFCLMQLFHLGIMATIALALGACSSTYILRCKEGYQLAVCDLALLRHRQTRWRCLGGGLGTISGKHSHYRFPQGLNSTRASGQWRGPDGEIIREDSHVLQLLHPDDEPTEKAIRELIDIYKRQFEQDALRAPCHIRALRSSSLPKKTHRLCCRSIASLQRIEYVSAPRFFERLAPGSF